MKRMAHLYKDEFSYISYSIVPRLNKKLQKVLNKTERQEQTKGAYALSNYFNGYIKRIARHILNIKIFPSFNVHVLKIIIIDDVKTTGSTLNACAIVLEEAIFKISPDVEVNIQCLTIAYEA